jgi:uncharacterized protein (TIGR03437 family)
MMRTLLPAIVLLWLAGAAQGQFGNHTLLEIDVTNLVFYAQDSVDQSRLSTDPNRSALAVNPATAGNPSFRTSLSIGDIVAVNGAAAKGAYVSRLLFLNLAPAPTRGQAVSDTTRAAAFDFTFEIQQADGRPLGSIMGSGLSGGPAAPGSPSAFTGWSAAVTGGVGFFIGARGTSGVGPTPVAVRNASVTEDPANRRQHGGGTRRYVISLIPAYRPNVVLDQGRPAIFHADSSPVSAERPARPGEVLVVAASGLGPTDPGVEPGAAFPEDKILPVLAPLEASVNGARADIVSSAGWPGRVDNYRVEVQLPASLAAGMATLQFTAAWVKGEEVQFPVRQ